MSGGAARPTPAAEEHFFADRQSQAQELARAVGAALRAALVARPRAALAVPGGSTPRAFLSALGREPLDWPRVTVTLTDERWVPVDHPDSNERLVRQELFAHAAAAARWVGLYTGDADPSAAAPACERAIAELLPFDVVVLGMGEDGHIASLFPNAPSITAALDPTGERLCGPGVGAGAGSPRLSLYAPPCSRPAAAACSSRDRKSSPSIAGSSPVRQRRTCRSRRFSRTERPRSKCTGRPEPPASRGAAWVCRISLDHARGWHHTCCFLPAAVGGTTRFDRRIVVPEKALTGWRPRADP